MSKIIYDVIQRFEVEDGIPRLLSTNIQVIQGGEDLLSLATTMLAQLGFYEKFEENRTSQYIGYKFKNPKKGAKRYQLIITPRKEGLCVAISKDILEGDTLNLEYFYGNDAHYDVYWSTLGRVWILPSKENIFWQSIQTRYPNLLEIAETTGSLILNKRDELEYHLGDIGENSDFPEIKVENIIDSPEKFDVNSLGSSDSYVVVNDDSLFPYSWQVYITSTEVLKEFIGYFAKILMEQC
ncbi:hypothetical protein BCD64_02275 [Nostoc sp. MBR 210]|uniref:hypothetical protein n=1 Tax=Aulosira sp. FACHB-615 TaxID=2692777 RepID=UPI00081DE482|nr:hypothetical protein [Aulosira sp. FACHB-615]MBD2490168.1 hypothetical protein [Aulosira sp. FACHB-615]OCQ99926.1 hypothetical protein BCD64_02275 [Nostoc sp. MBR 210]